MEEPGHPARRPQRDRDGAGARSVAVTSTAKRHTEGRFKGNPYASGFWRIAPGGH